MSTATSRPLSSLGELASNRQDATDLNSACKIEVDSLNFYYGE